MALRRQGTGALGPAGRQQGSVDWLTRGGISRGASAPANFNQKSGMSHEEGLALRERRGRHRSSVSEELFWGFFVIKFLFYFKERESTI